MRSLVESDWPNFKALYQDPNLNQFINRSDTVEQLRHKFELRLKPWAFESGDWLSLVIESNEEHSNERRFMGLTGFYCTSVEHQQAEVGYVLVKAAQGKGYGTESLVTLTRWAQNHFVIHKLTAICAVDNLASQRLLEKCGFVREGLMRQNYRLNDQWIDEYLYAQL